jgi:DNA-binding protein HU-beta
MGKNPGNVARDGADAASHGCRRSVPQAPSHWSQEQVFSRNQQKERTMAKAMTKSQILSKLADELDITKKQSGEFIDALVNLACKEAKNGFTIPGLGKLVLVKRKARMGRNPATGEQIKIPAKTVLKFRIAKAAKDCVLGTKK